MKKRPEPDPVSMTPMIDIVFQMIIFFVCTVDLDREKFQKEIKLAETPNTEAVKEAEPQTMYIQLRQNRQDQGEILLGALIVSEAQLKGILQTAVAKNGQHWPVVIHADGRVRHNSVARVMDIVAACGLYDISLSGKVEDGAQPPK